MFSPHTVEAKFVYWIVDKFLSGSDIQVLIPEVLGEWVIEFGRQFGEDPVFSMNDLFISIVETLEIKEKMEFDKQRKISLSN